MSKLIFGTILVTLGLTSSQGLSTQQQLPYNQEAELDAEGNIYVSSDQGKLIWMSNTKHCSEMRQAPDRQTVGCRVIQDPNPDNTLVSLQLEIYRKGGHKVIIAPGAPIGDWRFWNDGEQVAVSFGAADAPATYALYDSATGRVIENSPSHPTKACFPSGPKVNGRSKPSPFP